MVVDYLLVLLRLLHIWSPCMIVHFHAHFSSEQQLIWHITVVIELYAYMHLFISAMLSFTITWYCPLLTRRVHYLNQLLIIRDFCQLNYFLVCIVFYLRPLPFLQAYCLSTTPYTIFVTIFNSISIFKMSLDI